VREPPTGYLRRRRRWKCASGVAQKILWVIWRSERQWGDQEIQEIQEMLQLMTEVLHSAAVMKEWNPLLHLRHNRPKNPIVVVVFSGEAGSLSLQRRLQVAVSVSGRCYLSTAEWLCQRDEVEFAD